MWYIIVFFIGAGIVAALWNFSSKIYVNGVISGKKINESLTSEGVKKTKYYLTIQYRETSLVNWRTFLTSKDIEVEKDIYEDSKIGDTFYVRK